MMKISTLLHYLFLPLIIISFFSCETDSEADFEVLAYEEPEFIDKSNYFPSAVGNTWEYVTPQGNPEMLEVKNETMMHGEVFYEINQLNGKYAAIRKSGSAYDLLLQGEAVASAGYQMKGTYYKIFLFDHNANIGDTWESTAQYTVSFIPNYGQPARVSEEHQVVVSSELLDRDMEMKIGDSTYEDVIKVRLRITAIGKTETYIYYFADNIGIIKYSEGINSMQLQKYSFMN